MNYVENAFHYLNESAILNNEYPDFIIDDKLYYLYKNTSYIRSCIVFEFSDKFKDDEPYPFDVRSRSSSTGRIYFKTSDDAKEFDSSFLVGRAGFKFVAIRVDIDGDVPCYADLAYLETLNPNKLNKTIKDRLDKYYTSNHKTENGDKVNTENSKIAKYEQLSEEFKEKRAEVFLSPSYFEAKIPFDVIVKSKSFNDYINQCKDDSYRYLTDNIKYVVVSDDKIKSSEDFNLDISFISTSSRTENKNNAMTIQIRDNYANKLSDIYNLLNSNNIGLGLKRGVIQDWMRLKLNSELSDSLLKIINKNVNPNVYVPFTYKNIEVYINDRETGQLYQKVELKLKSLLITQLNMTLKYAKDSNDIDSDNIIAKICSFMPILPLRLMIDVMLQTMTDIFNDLNSECHIHVSELNGGEA